MSKHFRIILLPVVVAILSCAAIGAEPKVTVVKAPPISLPRRLDLKELEPEVREKLKGYDAYTDTKFILRPTFIYDMDSSNASRGQINVRIVIKSVKVELKLTTQISLQDKAPPELIAHEEGHRRIAERCYEVADVMAQSLAKKMVRKTFEATEDTAELAEKRAVNLASWQLMSDYDDAVSKPATKIHKIYDELTAHGINQSITEDQAIRDAIQQFARSE